MKTKKLTMKTILLYILLSIGTVPAFAFDPPPPPPPGGSGDQEPAGGGAPIEGGMIIFIGLAVGYATWKKHRPKEEGSMKNKNRSDPV
jgi:hypothetical protein